MEEKKCVTSKNTKLILLVFIFIYTFLLIISILDEDYSHFILLLLIHGIILIYEYFNYQKSTKDISFWNYIFYIKSGDHQKALELEKKLTPYFLGFCVLCLFFVFSFLAYTLVIMIYFGGFEINEILEVIFYNIVILLPLIYFIHDFYKHFHEKHEENK